MEIRQGIVENLGIGEQELGIQRIWPKPKEEDSVCSVLVWSPYFAVAVLLKKTIAGRRGPMNKAAHMPVAQPIAGT
jgi:hypothetical protein